MILGVEFAYRHRLRTLSNTAEEPSADWQLTHHTRMQSSKQTSTALKNKVWGRERIRKLFRKLRDLVMKAVFKRYLKSITDRVRV